MKILELPPTNQNISDAIEIMNRLDIEPIFQKALNEALYWDKIKYLTLPEGVSHEAFWTALKLFKIPKDPLVFGEFRFNIGLSKAHLKMLHEFDLNLGGSLLSGEKMDPLDRESFLISSLMEEAITSSQIEGAVTTRQMAKEMLIQNKKPVNESERMIYNNYITIRRIKELASQPISETLLLEVQQLITAKTLDNEKDSGRFRQNNEVRVVDALDGSVVHQPPDFQDLPQLMRNYYDFFNLDNDEDFIHPVVKASILHFLIGFIHPFVDGNGRTARTIFYWYMLKKGYLLTEFLSISSIILISKTAYAKAFLYSETDELDLRYFLHYKLKVIKQAYNGLREYINRKVKEKAIENQYLKIGGINERQAKLIKILIDEPEKYFTVKEVQNRFGIVNQSARSDLRGLENLGFLRSTYVNKKKQIFIRSDDIISRLKEQTA